MRKYQRPSTGLLEKTRPIGNKHRQIIRLGGQIANRDFYNPKYRIPLALGQLADGRYAYFDLAKLPHMLIAGRTGCGKSVFIQSIIMSLFYRFAPTECKTLIIDTKDVDYNLWDDTPHMITPVIHDANAGINALKWVVEEIDARYERLEKARVRTIVDYNQATASPMPYLVVIVDELADLMAESKYETETCVQQIAQKARAVGIHLILATGRPDAEIITGRIKAVLPTRAVFQARNPLESIMMLGEKGAENLLSCGDMLFSDAGRTPVRIQPAFVSDDEIAVVADHLCTQGRPDYIDGITDEE